MGVFGKVVAVRAAVAKKAGKATRGVEVLTHFAYLTVVFLEAHGAYGLFAGIAGLAVLVALLIGGDNGEV